MNLLHKILDRVGIVIAVYADAERYSLRSVECRLRRGAVECGEPVELADAGDGGRRAYPVVVVTGGHGVITKQAAGEIAARVTAAGSGFRWTRRGESISFVRDEQIAQLESALGAAKVKLAAVECAPVGMGNEEVKRVATEAAQRYWSATVNLRTLVRPTAAGSALARAAAARLRLPVLALVLLTLVVNTMTGPGVRARHEAANMELESLRKTIGQADEASRRRRELVGEYDLGLPRRMSWLCDRAAMAVPAGITLTVLAVQPPLRAIENNRKTTFAEGRVEIAGRASGADEVSRYVEALAALGIAPGGVRLESVERERETGSFGFKISLEL